jgi:hypothetical protein
VVNIVPRSLKLAFSDIRVSQQPRAPNTTAPSKGSPSPRRGRDSKQQRRYSPKATHAHSQPGSTQSQGAAHTNTSQTAHQTLLHLPPWWSRPPSNHLTSIQQSDPPSVSLSFGCVALLPSLPADLFLLSSDSINCACKTLLLTNPSSKDVLVVDQASATEEELLACPVGLTCTPTDCRICTY